MDSVISLAVEEICSHGNTGLSLSSLWPKLSHSSFLTPSFKASIWNNLLLIPPLRFKARNAVYNPNDPKIQCLKEAEKLDLKIIADEQLRDNFIGLYNTKSTTDNMSSIQRRVLERLAIARANGITQNQLAKEFGIEGRNFFYVVRNLECRGLIVRQPAVVKTKETCNEGGSKNSSCVSTNMMYLYRYAKPLGSQEKIEISKEDYSVESLAKDSEGAVGEDCFALESVKEDVLINDYVPAMQAICDKLEEANGKVLVVTDIKRDLGYAGSRSGHRAWRRIRSRLVDAHLAEEFDAVVNNKVEHCLRLLKSFSLKDFKPTIIGSGNILGKEKILKFGRKLQQTEQLVDLPLEHQIHDMIGAEGSDGLTIIEICERLGLDKKRNYSRLHSIFTRFGMHLQAENHNKITTFRVWASGNYNHGVPDIFHNKLENSCSENKIYNIDLGNHHLPDKSTQTSMEYDHSVADASLATPETMKDRENDVEPSIGSLQDGKSKYVLLSPVNLQESFSKVSDPTSVELDVVSTALESNVVPSEPNCLTLVRPSNSKAHQVHPSITINERREERILKANVPSETKCLALVKPGNTKACRLPALTTEYARREQKILERLQDENFILRGELYRWLVTLETIERDKAPKVDRKTIDRIVNKLQQQGRCKCMTIHLPLVTNCGRSRSTTVVLHPSKQNLTPELLNEIHDKARAFDMQTRGKGSTKCKNNEPVLTLTDVQRTQNLLGSDARASRSEFMRTNGFVLAKMVRAKLLHGFLWEFSSATLGWNNALSSDSYKGTCSFFSLKEAIKAIPLELFLQVVGSTQKFDELVEKCKRGLCLSDLPTEEYKTLMDTLATGRLSSVVDILRRLKLIRLVSNGHLIHGVKDQHTDWTHALELKPYIEEPLSLVITSHLTSCDLRPRIRHDFVLSNRDALNTYWLTLEYCYAASDPRAALQAFPGSVVNEVFLFRSWATLRVMTTDQRAELLKRIVKENSAEKLPFKLCQKIAKELNLNVEQVLRVYYDKYHKRLNRLQSVIEEEDQLAENNLSRPSRKRRRSIRTRSMNCVGTDNESGHLSKQKVAKSLDAVNEFTGEKNLFEDSSKEHNAHSPTNEKVTTQENGEDTASNDEENKASLIDHFSKGKPTRRKRFSWTLEADRQLMIQYAKHRAILGPKFNRVDWASLSDLPTAPSTCRRRMSSLKRNTKLRKSVMRLCNLLSERYARHLKKTQKNMHNDDDNDVLVRSSSTKVINDVDNAKETALEEDRWDDFDDYNIKRAFEDIFQLNRMTKMDASKRVGPASEEWSNINMNGEEYKSATVLPTTNGRDTMNPGRRRCTDAVRRSRRDRLHQKLIKLLNEDTSIGKQVKESVAVSNAVELLKLVFLSSSTAPDVPKVLVETLRRYSERDIFAAYSYLRDKKIMIGGNDGEPFILSPQFLHSISKSPFPANTGKRAAKFSGWLHDRESELMEGEVNLTADLQCGDVLNLFSLVYSGELSVSLSLPDEGVGEAEDLKILKRRTEGRELCDTGRSKKSKYLTESELMSRREKGFPGIMVSVQHANLSTAKALELFTNDRCCTSEIYTKKQFNTTLSPEMESKTPHTDCMKETLNVASTISVAGTSGEPLWEAMAGYAAYLVTKSCNNKQISLVNPEIFKVAFASIQKAGDNGLSLEEVASATDITVTGGFFLECIIDVLQAFGRVLKVNAYDSVRVVDALYRSKYFLTSTANLHQDPQPSSPVQTMGKRDDSGRLETNCTTSSNPQTEVGMEMDGVHTVTILNRPEEFASPLNKVQTSNVYEGSVQGENNSAQGDKESQLYISPSGELCTPILPWINTDGAINKIIYNGLTRRVLGTVMQNPGIVEDEITRQMDVLNPQSCRKLLELMILDGHLNVREMHKVIKATPPLLLGTLLGSSCRKPKFVHRKHYFANPMSTLLL